MEGGERKADEQCRKHVEIAVIGEVTPAEQMRVRCEFDDGIGYRGSDDRRGDAEPESDGESRHSGPDSPRRATSRFPHRPIIPGPGTAGAERRLMAKATVALLGLPTDSNSSYLRGPAKAPGEIRAALRNEGSNAFTESGQDLNAPGALADLGDAPMVEDERDRETIAARVSEQLDLGRRVLSLGGDHSVTHPIVTAYAKRYPDLSIVHFDAHPDLYPIFEGNRFSHAVRSREFSRKRTGCDSCRSESAR